MGVASKDRRLDHKLEVHGGLQRGEEVRWGDTDEAGKDVGMLMPEQLDPVWKIGAIISSGFRGSQAGVPTEHSSEKSAG